MRSSSSTADQVRHQPHRNIHLFEKKNKIFSFFRSYLNFVVEEKKFVFVPAISSPGGNCGGVEGKRAAHRLILSFSSRIFLANS